MKTSKRRTNIPLYFCFKDFILTHPDLSSKQVLQDILKYSEYMHDITSCSKNSNHPYELSCYRLNKLDMSTIYPLVFICFDAFVENKTSTNELDINDMNDIMKLIESYIARRIFFK